MVKKREPDFWANSKQQIHIAIGALVATGTGAEQVSSLDRLSSKIRLYLRNHGLYFRTGHNNHFNFPTAKIQKILQKCKFYYDFFANVDFFLYLCRRNKISSPMQNSKKYKLSIIVGAVVALIYVLIPVDVSPDAVPVVGWIDDIVAVLLAITNGIIWGAKLRKGKS